VYADVMDWFVWFCSQIFLVVTIFKEEFGWFVGEDFREGLFIVPILLLANIMLGMYVNLSIWYKLTDKTKLGAVVAILGAVLTVILLFILVPLFGYEGAAWATLICYSFMAMVSYFLGKKYFPIQYKISIITFYILSCIGFWIVSIYTPQYLSINTYIWKVGLSLLAIFFVSIFKIKPLINVLNTYAKS
jgi:O-antigen/teichoic acid export membrane protein